MPWVTPTNVSSLQEIDHEKERIFLAHSQAHATPEQILKVLPEGAGRYHLYRFKHEFNNQTISSTCTFTTIHCRSNRIHLRPSSLSLFGAGLRFKNQTAHGLRELQGKRD